MSATQIAILIPVSVASEYRQVFVEEWAKTCLPLTVSLECGNGYSIKALDEVPNEDVPCPCGDGRHWLVKYYA